MAFRLVKFALAVALLPLCVGMTQGVAIVFDAMWSHITVHQIHFAYWFGGGALAFAFVTALLWRPVVVYVFGHELVHALATWLCLGSVSNFKASTTGGSITSSKSNTLIRLAPYCIPLYLFLAAGIYLALNQWWHPLSAYYHWTTATMGFFYAFHLGFTLWSLHRDQPDLKPDGWFFSLVIIYLANLAIFALLLGFVLSGDPRNAWPALCTSSIQGWNHSYSIYLHVSHSIHTFYLQFANR